MGEVRRSIWCIACLGGSLQLLQGGPELEKVVVPLELLL